MQEPCDVLIIGSGPAGTHAAIPLLNAGLRVTMLDGGNTPSPTMPDSGARSFEDIRQHDTNQWKLFLGEDLSSIPVGGLEGGLGGGMVSGNRSFVTRDTAQELPLETKNAIVMESLAKGGMGAVWGAACAFFSPDDLRAMGLPAAEMEKYYDAVVEEIGISGPSRRVGVQPAMPVDHHAEAVQKQAAKKGEKLKQMGITVTQPHSAVLTHDKGDRKATTLSDMDYYSDSGKSIYRPQFTIDKLIEKENFTYIGGVVVERIEETSDGVVVFGHRIGDHSVPVRWTAKKVIVAAGAVNTGRILLRSFDLFDTPIPFVAKPHVYTACLHPATIGKRGPERRSSLCQLLVIDEEKTPEGFQSGCAQLYSYRAMLLFRLLGNIPFFPVPQTMALLSMLAPALIVADIRFPSRLSDGHTMTLRRDKLEIVCKDDMNDMHRASLKRMYKGMRKVGLIPLKTSAMPPASTSHHAGTVPVAEAGAFPLTCSQDGKVHGKQNIYVADASMFTSIPALPYTLTIMANARRVGEIVGKTL